MSVTDVRIAKFADLQRRPDPRSRSRPDDAVAADLRHGPRPSRFGHHDQRAQCRRWSPTMTSACRRHRWAGCSRGFGVEESGTTGTDQGADPAAGHRRHAARFAGDRRTAGSRSSCPQGTFWTRNVQLSELDLGTFVQKMFQDKLKEPVRDQLRADRLHRAQRHRGGRSDPDRHQEECDRRRGRLQLQGPKRSTCASAPTRKKFSLFSGQSPVGVERLFRLAGDRRHQPAADRRAAGAAWRSASWPARSPRCSPSSISATPSRRPADRSWPARRPARAHQERQAARRCRQGSREAQAGGRPQAARLRMNGQRQGSSGLMSRGNE